MRHYECMLLLEPTIAAKEWDKASGEILRILTKNGAEHISTDKWGERKLAYPVKRNKRGTYALTYFKSPDDAMQKIQNDIGLSDIILRALIIACDGEVKKKEPPKDFETAAQNEYFSAEHFYNRM